MRALFLSVLFVAWQGPVGALAEPAAAKGGAAEAALPSAPELAAALAELTRRPGLSRHAADLATQASGVQRRLKEAAAQGESDATLRRLTRLCHALLRAAEATDARDRERAAYETSARRLTDVEAQLAAAAPRDAGAAR